MQDQGIDVWEAAGLGNGRVSGQALGKIQEISRADLQGRGLTPKGRESTQNRSLGPK